MNQPRDMISDELRVLILEDAAADAELCKRELERAGLRFTSRQVETRADFEAALDEFRPGLIISDFTLPGAFDGLTALELARRKYPQIPFVFVSGTIGEERAVEAMRHGATDYVLKERMAGLGPAVVQVLERGHLRKEKEKAELARRDAEARFQDIFDNVVDGIVQISADGRLVAANAAFARMLGYRSPEALTKAIADLSPLWRDLQERARFIERLNREGLVRADTRFRRTDGSTIWVSLNSRAVRAIDGRVLHYLSIVEDISERKRAEEALVERERSLSLAQRIANLGSWELDLGELEDVNRNPLRWSDQVFRIFGYEPGAIEVSNDAFFAAVHPDDREGIKQAVARTLETGAPYSLDHRIVLPDGGERVVHEYGELIRDPDTGKPVKIHGTVQDVTEGKRAESAFARVNRVLAVLSAVNSAIVRVRNRQELLEQACRVAIEHGKFKMVLIGTLDRASLQVLPAAWAGLSADFVSKVKLSVRDDIPEGKGVTGQALRAKKTVWNNDLAADPNLSELRQVAVQRGIRSIIALPLLVEDEVEGVIILYAEEPGFFTKDEVRVLEEMAANLSFALAHMAGQQKIEKLSRIRAVLGATNAAILRSRNKQQLFYEACHIAVEHGKFGIAWIGELDAAKLEVTPAATAGLEDSSFLMQTVLSVRADSPQGQGVLPRTVRERRPVYDNDITVSPEVGGERRQEAIRRGYRSVIGLPLIVDGAVAGTFSMFAKELNYFDEEEVNLLTELAGNISFALEHMVRQQRIEKLSRIRAVSSEINAAIVRIRERHALLTETCRIASEHGKFEMIWIGTINAEKQEVHPVAWKGFSTETAHAVSWTTIGAAKGTLGEAMHARRAAVRDDIETQLPAGKLRQEALEAGCHSTVCLPLVVDDKVTNLIALFATGRGFFDKDELALLDEAASNISFALESIARQEKIDKLSRIRAVSSRINAAIVRIRNRQELFEEACRIVVEAGRFPFAWLGIVDRDAKQLRAVASAGAEGGFLDTIRSGRSLDEPSTQHHGPARRAVLEKKVVVANDIQNDPRVPRKQELLERNINSVAMLPLLVSDEAIGVLALHARETGFFDEEEIKMLSELAGDIAFALDHIEKAEKLDYLSYYDALTGLPNRSLFIDRTSQQMRSRGGEPLMVGLVLLNLERFRNINESLGRHGGDELLKLVARRLERAFNGKDYLARIGADGFGVVVRGIRDAAAFVYTVENQALGCFEEPFKVGGSDLRVAARAGIALYPADGGDADTLFRNAEAALKKTHDAGEHYLFYAADMNARAAHALSLEMRLRKALEAQQFVLHYQPKINLSSDAICGLEALIRWQDPESGLVAPGTFIPLLEETGLILEVGKWALGRALADHREWSARGCSVPRIAVNVSLIQLQQRDFTDMVVNVMQKDGNATEALEIEITESLLMKDVEASIRKLSILRGLGIHVAMDDFGTGYSSLSYIARLPINSVKIDRSFIHGVSGNPQDMAIVTTIIALAHSLNLRVVAEGVETGEQARLLKLLKCDEAQGYLFSKPLPAAEIEPLLRAAT